MVLPQTYVAALTIAILGMVCWGSWASSYKLVGKWRFELFYWDYALGALAAALVAAATVGTLGFDGFLFSDDLMRASRRSISYGLAAGGIFNLANMLLLAAISVAGMSVSFPMGLGVALVVSAIWRQVAGPQGNAMLLFVGVVLVLLAMAADVLAYRRLELAKAKRVIKAGKAKSTAPKIGWKGIALSVASGLLMGSFFPLVQAGQQGETGLGPYAMGFVFTCGIICTTFVYSLFFMNLPVQGGPVEIPQYFKGTLKQHALGLLGGTIWAVGAISNLVATTTSEARLEPAVSFGVSQGAAVVGALWGLLVWKEFRVADFPARLLMGVVLILFTGGVVLVSVAQPRP